MDQILSGIGLISNAGARFEAPETISARGRFEDVQRGGYDPEQHLKDMALDGVAGEVLYPSQGLFYFKVADPPLMSAIFRAYNDWLAEFCRTDPARLKGIAMINLDDVPDAITELERASHDVIAAATPGLDRLWQSVRPVQAAEVVRQLEPRFVVPMHYAIPGLKLQLDSLDRFLKEMAVTASEPQPKLSVQKSSGDYDTKVVVLEPKVEPKV